MFWSFELEIAPDMLDDWMDTKAYLFFELRHLPVKLVEKGM